MTVATYKLKDVVEQSSLHPETFLIPSIEDRLNLKSGWFAKLIFESTTRGGSERMWVHIMIGLDHDLGYYAGVLDNTPTISNLGLKKDDPVTFEPRNVADFQIGDPLTQEDIRIWCKGDFSPKLYKLTDV